MTTIDDLGRTAAAVARAEATRDVDVEHGLAAVLADARAAAPITTRATPFTAGGTRSGRARRLAVAAALAVLTGTVVALAVLADDEHRTVVPVDTVGTSETSDTVGTSGTVARTEPATTVPEPLTTTPATTTPATTTPATTGPTGSGTGVTIEPLGIDATCDPTCITIVFDPDGNLVVYDPRAGTLQISGPTPRTVDVAAAGLNPDASYLEAVSAEQVAYLATQPPDTLDPVGELVAVATTGPKAGQAIIRAGGIDLSGDTDLVAAPMGVVAVGCCDGAAMRPDPAAEPILGWFTPAGAQTVDGPTDLRVELVDGVARVVRTDGATSTITWTIPDVAGYRGMPPLVATNDGGAMISLQDTFDPSSPSRVVVLHPDGTMDERTTDGHPVIGLSPDGWALVLADDGQYARLHWDGVDTSDPAVVDDDTAIAPFVDPSICATTSSSSSSFTDVSWKPFSSIDLPLSIQVVGRPAPSGAGQPFAVLLRYPAPQRAVVGPVHRVGSWDVVAQAFSNGNGEARWDLPDGTQGYLRSRGLDEAAILEIVDRLSARPTTAAVPGFDDDADDAPADLRLVADDVPGLSGSQGYARCTAPSTGLTYLISALGGDPAFVFLGVIDRPVPIGVGVVGDDVVVIEGWGDGNQPTIADVVARPGRA